MALWADGDAASPDNMNNQQLSALTVDGATKLGSTLSVEGAITIGTGFIHKDDELGALEISGGVGTTSGANIVLQGNDSSTSLNITVRAGATAILSWDNSGNTWDFQLTDVVNVRALSLLSGSAAIPSVVSGRGFMYVDDLGAAYWVGGSGSSTTLGVA